MSLPKFLDDLEKVAQKKPFLLSFNILRTEGDGACPICAVVGLDGTHNYEATWGEFDKFLGLTKEERERIIDAADNPRNDDLRPELLRRCGL